MTREQAWTLMTDYTKSDSLRKHMLAVEAAMRFYAKKFNEDEQKWAVVGLIHDFDYEQNPSLEQHPFVGVKILEEKGYPEDIRRAVLAHAEHTGVKPESLMEKAIFAVDELTGFIVAVALVRPTKSIMDVSVKSVKKKMKDKGFARNVSRDDIRKGADLLGFSLEEHIENVLHAMQGIAKQLGLE